MTRLDVALVARGLFESRARAQAAIASGSVSVSGRVVTKPSLKVSEDTEIAAKAAHPWVSRGGVKLAHALDVFKLDPDGMIALDVGASTGGFTDVLLTRGAEHVYAVDVGTDQLHKKIRGDSRVIVMEQTDARQLTTADFTRKIDLVVCDASFISATKILGVPMTLARPGAHLVTLIKPQFEMGRDALGKGGVIRDKETAQDAVRIVRSWVEAQGWTLRADCKSPITGGSGNHEYLLHAVKG